MLPSTSQPGRQVPAAGKRLAAQAFEYLPCGRGLRHDPHRGEAEPVLQPGDLVQVLLACHDELPRHGVQRGERLDYRRPDPACQGDA
jgi:hypothetical protein